MNNKLIAQALEEYNKRLALKNYEYYLTYTNKGKWNTAPHLKYIINEIEEVIKGNNNRLIVNMGPRMGKSELFSKNLPPFLLMNNPELEIVTASYSGDLATNFNQIARDKFIEWAPQFNSYKLAKTTSNHWTIDKHRGSSTSVGIGGTLVGKGADCFPKGTMIQTNTGLIDISELEIGKGVLTYNHFLNIIEYKPIIAIRKKDNYELIEFTTESGRKFRCTPNHRIWDGTKYTEARNLKTQQAIFRLCDNELPTMQQRISNNTKYVQQSSKIEEQDKILQQEMFRYSTDKNKIMQLWESIKTFTKNILQQRMQTKSENLQISINRYNLQNMPENISTTWTKIYENLFKEMWKQITFNKYDQRNLQSLAYDRTNRNWKMVSNTRRSFIKRFKQMSSMWDRSKLYSSQRRESTEQYINKFNNSVQHLSYNTSQIKSDTISTITWINLKEEVWDIEVADNHNFFAEDILVHNCLIIDDYCKSLQEALSPTVKENTWDWYQSVARTRLSPNGVIIIIATPWTYDDLCGKLIQMSNDGSGEKFKIVKLPAYAEENDPLGREQGELLWPSRFNKENMESTKNAVGSYIWQSQYQCNPVPSSGTMFKRSWFKFYKELPQINHFYITMDATFKDSKNSDYVVMQCWGKKDAEYFLIDQIRDKMDFVTTVATFKNFCNKYPRANAKYIEDKANGTAIINSLQKEVSGLISINPKESKEARAQAISPLFEAGNIYLPQNTNWIDEYINEFLTFPLGKHDDQVDATTQILNALNNANKSKFSNIKTR